MEIFSLREVPNLIIKQRKAPFNGVWGASFSNLSGPLGPPIRFEDRARQSGSILGFSFATGDTTSQGKFKWGGHGILKYNENHSDVFCLIQAKL